MSVREKINQNPRAAVGAIAATVLIASVVAALQFSSAGTEPSASDKAFFTIDDGKTWFVDDAAKLPPFTRDGKEAWRAYVFECDGKQFANHLERFTPAGLKAVEAQRAGRSHSVAGQLRLGGAEVKKPGAKQWMPLTELARAGAVLRPTCPHGSGTPTPVEP